ncbi:C40 family peptidase [Pseudozobellia thermophila]|uniref:SH3 domain-containing protein n=1 Tax=Pseudozobellia thermophila TaxID=192903 RepID=A0A1M6GPF0_9FLAO|nr:C40 family peptidase [Pseudozobellia thermophila]SHJ11799.1 SH3 domain-containing protein [Pseudozobellia thermophila]
MQYGICHLSLVSVRAQATDSSEMVSQLLYGEHFKVLEQRKYWSRVRIAFDQCEGWVLNQQITLIDEEAYTAIEAKKSLKYACDLVSFVEMQGSVLLPIVLGSTVSHTGQLSHTFDGNFFQGKKKKTGLIETALLYLNAPFQWGGKSPFGIDASAFTQMVYKINGYKLLRKASEQSSQGRPLSFIEESEAGDLAFFDNNDGEIYHVGIIMDNNYIIHVDGKVRIDRLDHTGIFNVDTSKYSFKLRVIKKVI